MLRQVYNSMSVVDAAEQRIAWLFDEFENIQVSVSGGKDSTVLCWMALQEARRRNRRIGIFFIDEEDIIKWVCANEDYECIGDLCMGRGLVGLHAFRNHRRFVGTELNHKRLSVLLDNITKEGGNYNRVIMSESK